MPRWRTCFRLAEEGADIVAVDLAAPYDAAALFLASDEARYITGVALPVDAVNTNKP